MGHQVLFSIELDEILFKQIFSFRIYDFFTHLKKIVDTMSEKLKNAVRICMSARQNCFQATNRVMDKNLLDVLMRLGLISPPNVEDVSVNIEIKDDEDKVKGFTFIGHSFESEGTSLDPDKLFEVLKQISGFVNDPELNQLAKEVIVKSISEYFEHRVNFESKLDISKTVIEKACKLAVDVHTHGAGIASIPLVVQFLMDLVNSGLEVWILDEMKRIGVIEFTEKALTEALTRINFCGKDFVLNLNGTIVASRQWVPLSFKEFQEKFNFLGSTELRKVFLKAGDEAYNQYANLLKFVHEQTNGQKSLVRFSLNGEKDTQWYDFFTWWSKNQMEETINFLPGFQLNRSGETFFKNYNLGANEYLKAVFQPLVQDAATDPNQITDKDFSAFLRKFIFVDLTGDEAYGDIDDKKGRKFTEEPIQDFFISATKMILSVVKNVATINKLRKRHGGPQLKTYFHCLELGSWQKCIINFLLNDKIIHGTYLSQSYFLHLLFLVAEIPIAVALSSNAVLNCDFVSSPIEELLQSGQIISPSTDDPFVLSLNRDSLYEEYRRIALLGKMSGMDVLEMVHNSNQYLVDFDKVPAVIPGVDIRLAFRKRQAQSRLEFIAK